jgi:prepilin-type N-terminal cleavage/methylation domain-containing protein
VAIRPLEPKYNSQGFTLIEMLVAIAMAGIMMAWAVPSLMSLDKPLRSGTLQFKNQLSLIRSKAISGSRAYRIRPKYPTAAEYKGEKYQGTAHNFIVEYATNCQVDRYGYGLSNVNPSTDSNRPYNATYPEGRPDGWQAASQLDLDLPDSISVGLDTTSTTTVTRYFKPANNPAETTGSSVTVDAPLDWSICYDNRGIAFQAVALKLQDLRADNRSTSALISVGAVGSIDITTKDKNGTSTNDSTGDPVF